MGSLVEKLNSVDSDIRFMGLEDLEESLITERLSENAVSPQVVDKVIALIGDPNYSVQSRATRVAGSLSGIIEPAVLTRLLLDARINAQQCGIALKRVFQYINSTTDFSRTTPPLLISQLLSHYATTFSTAEGCDAVYEYILHTYLDQEKEILSDEANKITEFYFVNDNMPSFSRAFDLLALCIPHVSQNMWQAQVFPVLNAKLQSVPEYLGMLSKIVPSQRVLELAPCVEKIALDVDDENTTEIALRILSAVDPHKYGTLARKFISYKPVGDSSFDATDEQDDAEALYAEADELDEDFEDGFFSDDEVDVDLSSPIRRAACQLAAATQDKNFIPVLISALTKETADVVRQAIYIALGDLHSDVDLQLKNEVLKDIEKSRTNLAKVSGIALFMQSNDWETALELITDEVRKNQSINVPQIVARMPELSAKDTNVAQVLATLLTQSALPKETLIKMISDVEHLHLVDLLEPVLQICAESTALVKNVALMCAASLTTESTSQDIIDTISQHTLNMLSDEQTTTLAALDALAKPPVQNAMLISKKIAEILPTLQADMDIQRAFTLLFKLPVAHRESIEIILKYSGSDNKTKEAVFKAQIPKTIEFPVFEWAVTNDLMDLITAMAQHDTRVLTWAFNTSAPSVHAAAVVGAADSQAHGATAISLADAYYKFSSTNFADLSEHQREFLILVNKGGISVRKWYTDDQMITAMNQTSVHDEQVALLGKALIGSAEDTALLDNIGNESIRKSVFQVYVDSLTDSAAAFKILDESPWLRENYTGTAGIRDAHTAAVFAEKFEGDPRFVISTARYLEAGIVSGMNLVLMKFASGESDLSELDPDTYRNVRAQALSILRFTVPAAGRSLLLGTINKVLVPDPNLVKDVMIGPFKMKVDDLDPTREEALSALGLCTSPEMDRGLLNETVRLVIVHRLEDNVQKTRLLAYRWLIHLLELDYARPMVEAHRAELSERIEKQLASPPKPNTVSWVLQEAKDLQLAAEELRLML